MLKHTQKMRGGFTLVEILTTMAIIGILLAVLLPALNQVGKSAMNVKQKAQFHAIEMALETFRADTGDYPPSVWDVPTYGNYSASQRLAEAIIGRDGLGFHPSSVFSQNGTDSLIPGGNELYYPGISGFAQAAKDANLAARKGPYLELESANAAKLSDIFYTYGYGVLADSYVLADSFRIVKHRTTGKKIGMPILYYKADRNKLGNNPAKAAWLSNTYNIDDSWGNVTGLLGLTTPFGAEHDLHKEINDTSKASLFYNRIRNPNFANPERPYRAESFILHSAGADGLYGTADDVFNFDEGK